MGYSQKLKKKQRNTKKNVGAAGTGTPPPRPNTDQYRFDRMFQAEAIRKQIQDNVGNIFHEIPDFEKDLREWVVTSEPKEGTCWVPMAGRTMEWKLHSDIRKYPQVWFRA